MAILATIKSGAGKIAGKVANKGGNIVAKASGLSSAQLEKIEEKRNAYLMEKPETDPESIERLLGSLSFQSFTNRCLSVKLMMREVLITVSAILR